MRNLALEDVIRYRLALDTLWILPDEMEVTAEDGRVTLRGVVADRLTEMILKRLARRIPGVVDVVSQLRWDRTGDPRPMLQATA